MLYSLFFTNEVLYRAKFYGDFEFYYTQPSQCTTRTLNPIFSTFLIM